MNNFSSRRALLRDVFQRPFYLMVAIIVALSFYSLNAILLQWKNLNLVNIDTFVAFFTTGIYYLTTRISFYTLIIISVLTGVLISILLYRKHSNSPKSSASVGALSTLGIASGVLLPGCASCGIGLAAALGLGSSLAILPFKGVEISLLAILFLSLSIASVTKSMTLNAQCKIPKRKK